MEQLRTNITHYAGNLFWVEIVPLSAILINQFAAYRNNMDSIQLLYKEEVARENA